MYDGEMYASAVDVRIGDCVVSTLSQFAMSPDVTMHYLPERHRSNRDKKKISGKVARGLGSKVVAS
jgi:hypothetical protein